MLSPLHHLIHWLRTALCDCSSSIWSPPSSSLPMMNGASSLTSSWFPAFLRMEWMQVRAASATEAVLPVHDQLFSVKVVTCVHPKTQLCPHYHWRQSWGDQHSTASRSPYPRTAPAATCVETLLAGAPSDRCEPSSQKSPSISESPVACPLLLSIYYAFFGNQSSSSYDYFLWRL